ncbi:AraC family transcriptional regulator [Bradyrhizobium sp. PRIMUS42]|uniref:helix-turn-helix domain-containing protein n=1 Tax=Bradyrhizobium sp. PRIMUS42 TaxID=2908926 RepID=UPI001FF4260D|nr:AraC family transcriptional regulator [Bradyrhizobium sp. PRIMUS42]MCJ9728672.1 helix-turn-helix domain-containing protein [Bradyrhizobium sp. PRIMUS42]
MTDVALRWGFNDLSHFSRSFRRRFGMSPREYRNLLGFLQKPGWHPDTSVCHGPT